MKLRALVCLLLAASNAIGQQIYDDFSAPNWTAYNTQGVNVYEQQGKLKVDFLRTASEVNGAWIQGGYMSTCRLDGDFDISTEYYAPIFPAGNGVRIALITTPAAAIMGLGDVFGFAVTSRVENSGASLYVSDFYPVPMSSANAVATTDKSGRLRLRRIGTQLTGYLWYKVSRAWVVTGQTNSYVTDPVHIKLLAYTVDQLFADVAVKVAYDNVKIASGTCVKTI